jgi:2-methylisocitrate lyase-like PEP mutase family enzyme
MSGFCTAAARLGAPDTGLISYGEMVDVGRTLHEATPARFPIVGDGDTGYGNAMNVQRTVRGYAAAGFAGVLIEDQTWPKSCGHVRGKSVVPRDEAVARVRAAADARDASGSGIVLVARSDARQAVGGAQGLEEALWRAAAFADAGADVVFVDALESEEEMRALCGVARAKNVRAMANMLEGGGKTPILPPRQLADMGFSLVAYPMSLLGVSIKAMRGALGDLRAGRLPPPEALGTFAEIQSAVGFEDYFREEARYAAVVGTGAEGREAAAAATTTATAAAAAAATEVVEPDAVVEGGGGGGGGRGGRQSLVPLGARGASSSSSSSSGGSGGGRTAIPSSRALEALKRSRFFRVSIRDRANGTTKLETRIPASFVGGLAALVPQVAGIDVDALLSEIAGGGDVAADLMSKPLVDVDAGGDRVQVFLE